MISYQNGFRTVALLMVWLIASSAHADWLDTFTFNLGVSNSPSGPFNSSANLWSQSAPPGHTPATIDLYGVSSQAYLFDDGKIFLTLGGMEWMRGRNEATPSSPHHVPFYFQLDLSDHKTVLVGDYNSPIFTPTSENDFKLKSPDSLTIGKKRYKITLEASQLGSPGAPPDPNGIEPPILSVDGYGLGVILDEIAPTPEPASFVLAGIGGVGFIGFVWGRRPRSSLRLPLK